MPGIHLITHTDLDGAGCAILMRKFLGNSVSITYTTPTEVDGVIMKTIEEMPKDELATLMITDLYPSEKAALELNGLYRKRNLFLQVLDHHETSAYLSEYPWAKRDMEACGTKLVSRHLRSIFNDHPEISMSSIEEFVEAVDAYDRWLLDHPLRSKGEDLTRLLFFVGLEEFVEQMASRWLVSDTEIRAVYPYLKKKEDRNVEKAIKASQFGKDAQGRSIALTFTTGPVSQIGDSLLRSHPEVDYVVIVSPVVDKVDLRSHGKVNVASIAKSLGGGGHPKSAGFPFSTFEVVLPQFLAIL